MAEKSNTYTITTDFQVTGTDVRVLVLDRDFESFEPGMREKIKIDGNEYDYALNSVPKFVTIKSRETFKGKTAEFI